MAFKKTALVQTVSWTTFSEKEGFQRIALKNDDAASESSSSESSDLLNVEARRSYYASGEPKIPVKEILKTASTKFDISPNPEDYIFEAIRANTVDVPNENHDAFTKGELLRFDLTAGIPVYRTYEGKPHHVHHRADNPKTARGVIVDSHYFDETPALDRCPGCDSETKTASARDPSGLHCKKCGTIVKDEFIEILVAVDTKKDPPFAEAVKTGQLNAGSMGCSCASTTCNVCNHVAYSTHEFCEHIKRGNKGTLWIKRGGTSRWDRIERRAAALELGRHGRRFVTDDFCFVKADDGFEVRKAFENCNDVVYEEYSRVDQPADPKARQREILKAAGLSDEEAIALETKALLLRAELNEVEGRLAKAAGLFDKESLAVLTPDGEIQELPPGAEIIDQHDEGQEGQDGAGLSFQELTDQESAPGLNPNHNPNRPNNSNQQPQQQWSPEALGILPKADKMESKIMAKKIFARDYNDLYAEVTPEGNAVVMSKAGAILVASAGKALPSEEERKGFGREVLASIVVNGLVDTVTKFDGSLPPRFAQILDAAVDDMKEYQTRPDEPTIHDDGEAMRKNPRPKVKGLPEGIEMDGEDAMDYQREMSPSVIDERTEDHENAGPQPDSSLSAVKDDIESMRGRNRPMMNVNKDDILEGSVSDMEANAGAGAEKKKKASSAHPAIPASTPKGITEQWMGLDKRNLTEDHLNVDSYPNPEGTPLQQGHQHKASEAAEVVEARYKKLNSSRIAAIQKEADERIAAAEASIAERFIRALKIVAKREALNLEPSPLKAAVFELLANEQVVGTDTLTGEALVVQPISQDLAQHYVEKSFQLGASEEIDRLVSRASELMKADPGYLASAEADLEKQAAPLPLMTSRSQLGIDDEEGGSTNNNNDHVAAMRHEAINGNNFYLTSASEVEAGAGFDKQSRLSQAVRGGASKTNSMLDFYETKVRPN